jgi:Flp pilus assembly protein TadG
MALLLVLLLAAVAFSVDVAYMQLVRTQLRIATDISARAGAEALQRTNDSTQARTAAKNAALANKVAGKGLQVTDSQVVLGRSTLSNGLLVFSAGQTPYNSVRVVADRSASNADGTVSLFFGKLLGRSNFSPQSAATVTFGTAKKRDFALVLDRSGSMEDSSGTVSSGGNGFYWGGGWDWNSSSDSKWDDLKDAVGYFFSALSSNTDDTEKVGMATYSDRSTLDKNLTTSYSSITSALNYKSPNGYTNISDGMEDGMSILSSARSDADKIMVVMTDGLWNQGYNPASAARTAASRGIKVITITFGADADQQSMIAAAAAGGGVHYHAPSKSELISIFTQIGLDTDGLQFAE